MVRSRDPREIHQPLGSDKEFNFSFDPDWMLLLEFYCAQCTTLVETEYLPPGPPLVLAPLVVVIDEPVDVSLKIAQQVVVL